MADDPVVTIVRELLQPICDEAGLSVYDVERTGKDLRVYIDRPGGIDLDAVTSVNRALGRVLDETDPIEAEYHLEVSSPGLERRLRTPLHWSDAIGERVKVKLRPSGTDDRRRVDGTVIAVDGDHITMSEPVGKSTSTIEFNLDRVDKAMTVFTWSGKETRTDPTNEIAVFERSQPEPEPTEEPTP